jgi:hypothetical protein
MTPEGGEHPRTATSDYLSANQRQLDIVFDLDLGELMPGHHVVARGIERSRSFTSPGAGRQPSVSVDRFHYEHQPGLTEESEDPTWKMTAADDVGTAYVNDNSGSYDRLGGDGATHGTRNIDAIPSEAKRLYLTFSPNRNWQPQHGWRNEIEIDLEDKQIVE